MTSDRHQHRLRTGLVCSTAIAALLLGGCVGKLETRPYRERTPTLGGALRGVTYSLPKLQYEIKLTRSLAECPGGTDEEGKPTALKFRVEVAETPQYVPGEAYTVNYDRLAGLLRTSSFEIKYWPNGNLKSLGAGAEDKTADFVKDAVKTGLSIASIASGSAVPQMAAAQLVPGRTKAAGDIQVLGCTTEAEALVAEQKELRAYLKERGKKLLGLVKDAERILARAAVRLKNEADREDLIRLFALIDNEEAGIATANERLTEIADELGVTETLVWNSDFRAVAVQAWDYKLSDDQQAKLAGLLETVWVKPAAAGDSADAARRTLAPACFDTATDDRKKCVREHLELRAGLHVQGHLKPCPEPRGDLRECVGEAGPTYRRETALRDTVNRRYRDARDERADSGVFVREPVRARLLFCRSAGLGEKGRCTTERDEGKIKEAYFPQLGQLRYLPLRVGPFQAREMALALAEDGRVESFTYKSTRAAAAGFAAMAADVVGQVDAAMEKIETERRSDLAYAREQQVAGLTTELAVLTKEEEIAAKKAPASVNPLQPILDETATRLAQIGLTKAKIMEIQSAQTLSQLQQP